MIVSVQFKRRMTNAYVLCIFISKLDNWQEPSPVILIKGDKSKEIHIYGAVLPLGLPIYLQIERDKKPSLDAKEVAKQWPEFQGK